jgi:ABC-type methionine transport system ATPase subunit
MAASTSRSDHPRRVAARPHGDHRAGARDQFLSAPVLRRHAPARDARDGLCQRAALLIADEPTTALDVTIQAQILDLIVELNRDFGAAIILISHALGVIANVCQRVIVMYAGEDGGGGPTEQVLADPAPSLYWALITPCRASTGIFPARAG